MLWEHTPHTPKLIRKGKSKKSSWVKSHLSRAIGDDQRDLFRQAGEEWFARIKAEEELMQKTWTITHMDFYGAKSI